MWHLRHSADSRPIRHARIAAHRGAAMHGRHSIKGEGMRKLISFVLAVLCCSALHCHASETTTEIPVRWQTLSDDSGRALAEIRSLPDDHWQALQHGTLSLGFTREAAWLRSTVTPRDKGGHILELSNPLLDQATQQNSALVEQSAAAADSLQQQAVRLVQVVGVFRLQGAT